MGRIGWKHQIMYAALSWLHKGSWWSEPLCFVSCLGLRYNSFKAGTAVWRAVEPMQFQRCTGCHETLIIDCILQEIRAPDFLNAGALTVLWPSCSCWWSKANFCRRFRSARKKIERRQKYMWTINFYQDSMTRVLVEPKLLMDVQTDNTDIEPMQL